MRKKFPALFLALLLALSIMPAGGMAAGTQFEIRLPEQPVRAGEEFLIAVDLTGNPGFSALQFTLAYDKSQMECIEVLPDRFLGSMAASNVAARNGEGAVLAAISIEAITGDGTVGSFRFVSREDMDRPDVRLTHVLLQSSDEQVIPVSVVIAGEDREVSSASPTPTAQATLTPTPTPTAQAALTPTPTPPAQEARFTDTAGNWAESYINAGAQRGLFGGYSDGSFRPGNRLTRAEFMMVLWNLAGRPDPLGEAPFTDIANRSKNIQDAITWAYGAGYVNGTTDTTFSPGDNLTRQAAMKILFGYAGGISGTEQMFTAVYDGTFQDSSEISSWARPAMYWGVYHEIISGTTPATLNPRGTITRAQMAAIMVRYTDKFGIS